MRVSNRISAKNLFLLVPIVLMLHSAYTSRTYIPELDEETWQALIPGAKPIELREINPHHHDSKQSSSNLKRGNDNDNEDPQGVDINPHRFDGPWPLRFIPIPPGVKYESPFNASTISVAPFSTPPPPLHETCKPNQAFSSSGHPCVPLKGLTRQFIYRFRSPNLTYMMCGIPKTGSSVQIGIMHRMNGKPYAAGGDIHHNENQILINMNHNEEEAAELFLDDDVPKFMIIRNPIIRALSAYLDKIEAKTGVVPGKLQFRRWIDMEFTGNYTWESMNSHWRAQTTMCGFQLHDLHSYFRKVRFENREKVLELVYRLIPEQYLKDGWGQKGKLSFREAALQRPRRTVNTDDRFYEYVDLEAFEMLEKIFARDISMLGYTEDVNEMKEELKRRMAKES